MDATPPHDRTRAIEGEQAWDERYRESERIWSGAPNPVLVSEAAGLTPGSALDAGAGEGADAIWLAEHGWRVTGVDVSGVALQRARTHASSRGVVVDWRRADLATAPAPGGPYDLVTAHYLHLPRVARTAAVEHLAAAVAPGGTLLVVGHDLSDADALHGPDLAESGWSSAELVGQLGPDWRIDVAEMRARPATSAHAGVHVLHDVVVRARRR